MKKTVRAVTIMILVSVLLTCPVSHALQDADGPCFGDGLRANPGHSTTAFISWALKHVDPSTIPAGASLPIPVLQCGTEPWQYLYGTVRLKTDETALRNFFINNYGKQMTEFQYADLTADWDRNGYATDCQGLLDAWLTYEQNEPTDINVQMNYYYWCTQKGPIEEIDRPYRIGEALFVQSSTGRMTHIGWICGFDADGEPLTVDARAISYGVIVSRVSDRKWTHRGLMTAVFSYPPYSNTYAEPGELPPETCEEADVLPFEQPLDAAPLWFGGGTGTQADPFIISAPEHLLYLAERVNGGFSFEGYHLKLTNDLVMNSTSDWTGWGRDCLPANLWTPIGGRSAWNIQRVFSGTLDGDGHTVRGLCFFDDEVSFAGLFGYISGGTVKNLNIDESYIHALNNVGGIAGYIDGGTAIENCTFRGRLEGELWVGGTVGYAESSSAAQTVNNCASAANIEAIYMAGGVIGCTAGETVIRRSFNSGAVAASDFVGGVVGECRGTWIENCYSSGRLEGVGTVGGIVGSAKAAVVRNSYSSGRLTAKRSGGGAAGEALGCSFENCYYRSDSGPIGSVGEPRTTRELSGIGGYPGFDFAAVWRLAPGMEYRFAQLRSNPHLFPPGLLWGDIDGDGEVTVADALLVLRCAMGIIEFEGDAYDAADNDCDGEVTVADALRILRICMQV